MRRRRPSSAFVLSLAALGAGCSGEGDTIIVVTAQLQGVVNAPIFSLRATVDVDARTQTRDFSLTPAAALTFPVTFAIEMSRTIPGPVKLEVQGLDQTGTARARFVNPKLTFTRGAASSIEIWLMCLGDDCQITGGDGGTPATDAGPGAGDASAACGNSRLDPGETCDVAIGAGKPGACPPRGCDDGIACTNDIKLGDRCTTVCEWSEIRTTRAGDACCPAGATHDTDADCSATCNNGSIEAGETCDLSIASGAPGACPSARDCQDSQSCTMDILISAGTCAARCVNRPIVALVAADGCCPANASHRTDLDCPVVCGNGLAEEGETCDIAIKAGASGACPVKCDDGDPCTQDSRQGNGCNVVCGKTPITDLADGDGCCLSGANASVDSDCRAICGNRVVEPGEQCDRGIAAGATGSCPETCGSESCLAGTLMGTANDCSARCVVAATSQCKTGQNDGCCPTGCNNDTDGDCSATCGNGTREAGETCDTGAAAGGPNACPTACNDGKACTTDTLASAGTCNARCVSADITALVSGDGCCPAGGNHNVDKDCPAMCGNGVTESPGETCDRAIAGGSPGACPMQCPLAMGCTLYQLNGAAATCTADCKRSSITACAGNDGCCASGCSAMTDNDCPTVCGNGVVEGPGEKCDKGLTAGNPGACAQTCNDGLACTSDTTLGSVDDCTRTCAFAPITACAAGDGCCPSACSPQTDADCAPVCGNGRLEMGEYCDPIADCPTVCPDDGDPCTREKLVGDPGQCTARCVADPIVQCLATPDQCCPSACGGAMTGGQTQIVTPLDPDCGGVVSPTF